MFFWIIQMVILSLFIIISLHHLFDHLYTLCSLPETHSNHSLKWAAYEDLLKRVDKLSPISTKLSSSSSSSSSLSNDYLSTMQMKNELKRFFNQQG